MEYAMQPQETVDPVLAWVGVEGGRGDSKESEKPEFRTAMLVLGHRWLQRDA